MKGIGSAFTIEAIEGRQAINAAGRAASETTRKNEHLRDATSNLPMTVHDAARFLGVSPRRCIFGLSESRFPTSA